ncbi:hypothetical protein ACIOD2_48520 [Amycolatopsis sp. NPDC088138]|uniref:hypothetical protein n=1 Tax=Amycolatopsis sp. NPDC088138 TaxID=3363938 RepID=UPI00380A8033
MVELIAHEELLAAAAKDKAEFERNASGPRRRNRGSPVTGKPGTAEVSGRPGPR